jgi:hypothetical protein
MLRNNLIIKVEWNEKFEIFCRYLIKSFSNAVYNSIFTIQVNSIEKPFFEFSNSGKIFKSTLWKTSFYMEFNAKFMLFFSLENHWRVMINVCLSS